MKEKHHFAADVDADYYMANPGYGVSNQEKQSQFISIRHYRVSHSEMVETKWL